MDVNLYVSLRIHIRQEEEVQEMKALRTIRGTWVKFAARVGYAFGVLTIALPARAFAAAAAGGALHGISRLRPCKPICRVQLLIRSPRRPSSARG